MAQPCVQVEGEKAGDVTHTAHHTPHNLSRLLLILATKTFSTGTELSCLRLRLCTKYRSQFQFILRPFALVSIQAPGVRPVNQIPGNSSSKEIKWVWEGSEGRETPLPAVGDSCSLHVFAPPSLLDNERPLAEHSSLSLSLSFLYLSSASLGLCWRDDQEGICGVLLCSCAQNKCIL